MTDWKTLSKDKKLRQEASIPPEWRIVLPSDDVTNVLHIAHTSGLLDRKELDITETRVEILLEKIASGSWSAVEVTNAFYKRAVVAHQLVNCLTEIFVEKALARARELDDYLRCTGTTMGPLHGLPISLKDQIQLRGLETVAGYASWVGQIAENDAVIVKILNRLGAVPFVRTNLPQTIMFIETHNHVFGRTSNPFNRRLTPGGSSGGEGALVGFRGSPLGIGSDLGGSIRMPSSFCGIYGLRPSNHRIPYRGVRNSMEGQDGIPSSLGPMSNDLAGIKLFMKSIINSRPWLEDPMCLRMPWSDEGYSLSEHGNGKDLCFGVLWDDGHTLPQPPVRRALETVVEAVKRQGHSVIPWKPFKHQEILKNAFSIYFAGGAEDLAATFAQSREPHIRTMQPTTATDPDNDNITPYWPDIQSLSAYELWKAHETRRILCQKYLDHWQASVSYTGTGRPVDAILAPVSPHPPPSHGDNRDTFYTVVWSALDFPALAFPVTTVDPLIDIPFSRGEFMSEEDRILESTYHPDNFKDAPVGVQLVTRRHEDEALIRMAEIIDQSLKQYVPDERTGTCNG